MHIPGKIMLPIGIMFIIIAAIPVFFIDDGEFLPQLDQGGELTISLYDEDQAGEIGFSSGLKVNISMRVTMDCGMVVRPSIHPIIARGFPVQEVAFECPVLVPNSVSSSMLSDSLS